MNLISEALVFATEAHGNQMRKGKNVPYIIHPIRVGCGIMESVPDDEEMIAAGILHDVLEDTDVDEGEIIKTFGSNVARMVLFCTAEKGKDWKDTRQKTIDKINNANPDEKGLAILMRDKWDNLFEIMVDYMEIGDKVFDRFSASKEDVGWYYKELILAFSRKFGDEWDSGKRIMVNTWERIWGKFE